MALLNRNMYPALDDDMIQRLRNINVRDVFDFANEDTDKLGRIMKMSYQDVKKFKTQILVDLCGKIKNGEELLSIKENYIVSTGIGSLDTLLNGGLHFGELYELCGVSSAGKTQICLSLAINVILETDGFVRYIDTKNDFSASRVHMILEAKGHNDEATAKVMNQLKVTRATNIHELLDVLHDLASSLKLKIEAEEPTKLVIIDSLPAIIFSWSEKCESFYFLNHLANVSKFIANEYHIPLITVNLINEWRDTEGFAMRIVDKPAIVKPNLGKFWRNVPNTRLIIEKLENEERKVTVWNSADLRVADSCKIILSESGVLSY